MAVEYQGGNDTILTNFYNRLAQDQNRFFSGLEKQQAAQAKAESERKKNLEKELASMATSINPKGLRPEDTEEFYSKYNEFKQTAAKAISEGGVNGAMARAEADRKLMEINMFLNNSLNRSKALSDAAQVFTTEKAALLPEGAFDFYKNIAKKPTSQITSEDDDRLLSFLKPQVDGSSIMSDIQKKVQNLTKTTGEYSTKAKRLSGQGNVPAALVDFEVRTLSKQAVANVLDAEYQTNPKFRYLVNEQFKGIDKGQALLQLANQLEEQGFSRYEDKLATRTARQDSDGADGSDDATYVQEVINRIANKDQEAIDEISAYFPQGTQITPITSKAVPGVSKGGFNGIRVRVPEQTIATGSGSITRIPGIEKDVYLSRKDFLNEFNNLINRYTSFKTKPYEVNKVGGKKTGKDFNVNAPVKKGQSTSKPKTGQGVNASTQLLNFFNKK